MSVLSLPRLYFAGEMYWNPSTPNNYSNFYEEETNEPETEGATDNEFKKQVMGNSSWNFYGDQGCQFVASKTKIIGGTLPDGSSALPDDSMIGKGVQILGNLFGDKPTACRLVDVDPYSSWTSQIFFNELVIGGRESNGFRGIRGSRYQRMHSYWLNFSRNYNTSGDLIIAGPASVVFQTSIPYSQLTIANEQGGGGESTLLKELTTAMQQGDAEGLMIRFSTYRTLYYQNGIRNDIKQRPRTHDGLVDFYRSGEVFFNPAYSLVVGSIGLWKKGEPATTPAGRYLKADQAVSSIGGSKAVTMGPIVTQLDRQRKTLSFDLSNTFPEWNSSGLKADFGPVTVQVLDNNDNPTLIATLDYTQYNQQAYEAKAGIVDIQLNDSQVQLVENGKLALSVNTTGQPVRALKEEPYTALSDEKNIYIEEGETKKCTIQVQYKGQPAPAGTKVLLAQYDNGQNPDGVPKLIETDNASRIISQSNRDSARQRFVSIGDKSMLFRAGEAPRRFEAESRFASMAQPQDPRFVDITTGQEVTVEGGMVTIDLKPLKPGSCNIGFLPFDAAEPAPEIPQGLDVAYANYISIRVMPFDNELEQNTPDSALTWEFVYHNMFRVYNLIYPVMSVIIPMDDRRLMEGAVMQIRAVLGEDVKENGEVKNDYWESTMYMSVTRDLSYGKRELLRRWCDLVEREEQPE